MRQRCWLIGGVDLFPLPSSDREANDEADILAKQADKREDSYLPPLLYFFVFCCHVLLLVLRCSPLMPIL